MSPFRRLFVLLALLMFAPLAAAEQDQDGDGSVRIYGPTNTWHKVTLTFDGPFARETDTKPNPFTDYRLSVSFVHEGGLPIYRVPGYFAADGHAGETSATEGNKWRVHFTPDRPGRWHYTVQFLRHPGVTLRTDDELVEVLKDVHWAKPLHGKKGSFFVRESDKAGRDLRAHGRLEYVGKRYLRFAGSGKYFLKAGADAPETLLAYQDFDGTVANSPKKGPLKSYQPHVRDWQQGDPTWKDGKGKGLIGAVNYLSSTGCNAFSFLTYNAGGDGDNVWPFIERNKKLHYDCSKLDQWQVVFDHATTKGMYLHFKLQETEIDDLRGHNLKPNKGGVPTSLDRGDLGPERRLYLREMIARFGHLLALNWNLGEENTQSTEQQRAMAKFIRAIDPYDHPIVLHTYPSQQDRVYGALLGEGSVLDGLSLQNSNVKDCHWQTLKWVERSEKAGKPWVVAFDEPGDASFGTPPDPDYPGVAKVKNVPLTIDDVRKHALWGTLMAGGAGIEYYFGYKLPENDLLCEDWRSREKTWQYSANALSFFRDHRVPFWEMNNSNDLIKTDAKKNEGYCLAKPGDVYLVYLPGSRNATIDLAGQDGLFSVKWFNPREGGALKQGSVKVIKGGKDVSIGNPPDDKGDWLALIRNVMN